MWLAITANQMISLSPYEIFNYLEGGIWLVVAVVLPFRYSSDSKSRKMGLLIAAVGFVAFGISDFLEATRQAEIPLWLWGMKVFCGMMLLIGRYTYLGWKSFAVSDRFFRLGVILLVMVVALIFLQAYING